MIAHKAKCRRDARNDIKSDYWTGELYKEQREKGLFPEENTDMAFMLTSDGVKVFKTRDDFSIWPLMLVCPSISQTDVGAC